MVIGDICHTIRGKTIQARNECLQQHLNHVRMLLVDEPRGWIDTMPCIITPLGTEGAGLGRMLVKRDGHLEMCGHGTMGAAAAAMQMGIVELDEPTTSWCLGLQLRRSQQEQVCTT